MPYVLVCDMPDRVDKQLYKAAPDLLKPNLGMLIEPNRDNIDKIASHNISLDISLSGDPQDDCLVTRFICVLQQFS